MLIYFTAAFNKTTNKSSAVAEMGDNGHNRHHLKVGRGCCGATENAGVENAIRSKLQGWKMQDWKKQE